MVPVVKSDAAPLKYCSADILFFPDGCNSVILIAVSFPVAMTMPSSSILTTVPGAALFSFSIFLDCQIFNTVPFKSVYATGHGFKPRIWL